MAPEVMVGRPVLSSSDVYSFGYLVDRVLVGYQQTFLTEPLWKLSDLCTVWDPACRPSLTHVTQAILLLTEQLTPERLSEKFMFKE